MFQLCVHKQGKHIRARWSPRLLTADTVNRFLFLSEKDHPDALCHHKIRLTQVVLWPNVTLEYVGDDAFSTNAQLTARIDGYPVDVCNDDRENTASLSVRPNLQQLPSSQTPPPVEAIWVLRFDSLQGLEEFATFVSRMNTVAKLTLGSSERHNSLAAVLPGTSTSSGGVPSRRSSSVTSVVDPITIVGSIDNIKEKSAEWGNSIEEKERKAFT